MDTQLQIFWHGSAEPMTGEQACLAEQPLTGCAAGWDAEKTAGHLKHEIVRSGIEAARLTIHRTRYNRHEENNIKCSESTTVQIVGIHQKRDASSKINYLLTYDSYVPLMCFARAI